MTLSRNALRIVEQSARNNALWCDAVCRAHGRPGEFHDALWLNRQGTPQYYPDAVTLAAAQAGSEQMRIISDLVGAARDRAWAVKDSFGGLDLSAFGFELLFEAQWICLNPQASSASCIPSGHRYDDVMSEEDLAAWEGAWRGDGPSGDESAVRTFLPGLLHEPDIRFVSVRQGHRIVGGGILNRGAGVVGLSNCFTLDGASEDVWRGLVSHARQAFPGATLVGYESGSDLETARRVGFEPAGALRVWCTPD